jgi:hypothetical protein
LPNTTLELVLDGETIECDVYEISQQIVPPRQQDYALLGGHPPEICTYDTTYRVVARRRRVQS